MVLIGSPPTRQAAVRQGVPAGPLEPWCHPGSVRPPLGGLRRLRSPGTLAWAGGSRRVTAASRTVILCEQRYAWEDPPAGHGSYIDHYRGCVIPRWKCGGLVAKTPVTQHFGALLKRAREAAGLSREDFGKLVNYAPSTIGAFETGERFPQPSLVKAADEHLATGDRFTMLYDMMLLAGGVYKEGFRPWRDVEREASCIWTYELALIPGLLQTEGYARALLGDEDTEVASRLARQEIFTREEPPPPTLVALIEERVLRTLVGDEKVMREQLEYLTQATQRHVIQIVPHGTRTYLHLDGPFAIATVDGRDLVFVETPVRGFVVEDPQVTLEVKRRWDMIRAQAMSVQQSIELIQEVMGQWT